jgi:hypothetical protein
LLAQAVDKTLERSDTYPAKDAADLGVPVPPPAGAIDAGQFFQVEAEVEAPVAPGAQASTTGPIRFYSKLPNEFRGFSNFAPSPVVIGGKRYPTVEHYFQAMKFPSDPAWQEAIRVAPTPAKAKQLGTQADKPVRADWDSVRETVMLEALRAKFQQNAGLLQQLKETGSRPLIEASPADPYWGEGRTGKGKNRMGKLLEQVREELREYVIPADVLARPQTPPKEEYFNLAVDEDEAEPVAMAAPVADVDELTSAMGAVALDEQKGGDPDQDRIIILTSDQKVLLISLRKERVIGSLQTLMKTVAVDCQLNFADNNDGTFRCLALGNSVDDFAYNPDLQRDITETEAKFKVQGEVPLAAPVVARPLAIEPVAAPVPIEPVAVAPMAAPVPIEPVAVAPMAAPEPVAAPVQEAPVKPKPKRVVYAGKQFYYKPELGPNGKATKYILFAMTDPDNTVPVGYIAADPVKGLPTGPIMPAM